ncbi:polysaccharide pyruvyl transferase family protein [Thermaurantiacus sp.]
MARPLKIGLIWHSDNSANLGVGALTVSNIALLQDAAARAGVEARFELFKFRDSGAPYVTGFQAIHPIDSRYLSSPRGFFTDVRRLDALFDIGGGDSFTDIYPDRRFLFILLSKVLAIAAGTPLILSPQTIGPFSRQPHRSAAAWTMGRARAVFTRDPLSLDAARALAPGARLFGAVDVAFALPFTPAPRGPGRRVGLNVSGLLYAGGYTGRNEFGLGLDYRDYTHRLIEALLARGDVRVELVKHVFAHGNSSEDDPAVARALAARYPGLVEAPDFASPSEAKSYISGLDFLVGARMHATIAAFSAGVPVVPVSYSRKFEGLFGGLGYRWLVPAKGMSTDEALAFTVDALDRRDEVAADIGAAAARVREGLETYVGFVAGLFADLARSVRSP